MTFRPKPEPSVERVFSEAERTAIYDVIYHRRDERNEFKPDPLDPTVLERMLKAAHAALSVGLSQPWRFILIRDPARPSKIKQAFERANAEAREMFSDNKKQEYAALKLEGIEKAPLNICVACERKGMMVSHQRCVLTSTFMPRPLRLSSLAPEAIYRIELLNRDQAPSLSRGDQLIKSAPLELSGAYLMDNSLTLPWSFPETMWVVKGTVL